MFFDVIKKQDTLILFMVNYLFRKPFAKCASATPRTKEQWALQLADNIHCNYLYSVEFSRVF